MLSEQNEIKLEINIQKIFEYSPSIWILNNRLIINPWIQEGTKKKTIKYLSLNENESTTYQNS